MLNDCPSPASYHHKSHLSLLPLLPVADVVNQLVIGEKSQGQEVEVVLDRKEAKLL
jgi:hypothetical protein